MDNSKDKAIEQIQKFEDGHINEEIAGFGFSVTNAVSKQVKRYPMPASDKIRALRLCGISLLCLAGSLSIDIEGE